MSQWKTFIAGLSGATGSFEGFIDGTNVITIAELYGAAAAITLTLDGSRNITGSCILTGLSIGAAVEGVSPVSINFRLSGAPAFN